MSGVSDTVNEKTSLGWMLIGLLGLQLALAVPLAWVLDSYFNVNVPASLMFFGKDGWCDIATEGVGTHCFGDFHERFLIDSSLPIPWPNNLQLSPIGPLLTGIADSVAVFLPSRLVLSVVILVYATCLIVPSVWAARGRPWPLTFLIVGIAGIATYPFIVTMDRLNSVALTVPLILAYLLALAKDNSRGVLLSVLVLSVIKPQFVVLYLVLIAHRHWRAAMVGALASVASCLVLIVGAGGGDLGRISQWFAATSRYGSGLGPHAENFTPINVSLSRLVFVATSTLESIQHVLFGSHLPLWASVHPVLVFIQAWVFLLATVTLVLWGGRIPPVALGIAALVLSTLVLGEYVAAYYLVFALPVGALFLRRTATPEPRMSFELRGELDDWSEAQPQATWMQRSALVATVLSCSLLVVPLLTSDGSGFAQDRFHRVGPIMQNLATACWMLFLVIACGVAITSFLREKSLLSPADFPQRSKDLARPT